MNDLSYICAFAEIYGIENWAEASDKALEYVCKSLHNIKSISPTEFKKTFMDVYNDVIYFKLLYEVRKEVTSGCTIWEACANLNIPRRGMKQYLM